MYDPERDTESKLTVILWVVLSFLLAAVWSQARADTNVQVWRTPATGTDSSGGVWTTTVTTTLNIYPSVPGSSAINGVRNTVMTSAYSLGTAGANFIFDWGGSDYGMGLPGGGYGYVASVYLTSSSGASTFTPPTVSTTSGLVSTSGDTVMTGSVPTNQLAISIPIGSVPSQFYNQYGTLTVAAVQDGQVIETGYINPGNTTTLTVNSTNTDPISLDLELPGYSTNPNGGIIHTGNQSSDVLVPMNVQQNGETGTSYSPLGPTPTITLNTTDFPNLPANTGNTATAGVQTSAMPIWTNPATGNSSYTQSGDVLSQSTYQQGVTNQMAQSNTQFLTESQIGNASNVLLSKIANNTANFSIGGLSGNASNVTVTGGNITANVDLTPVVNAVNGVNSTVLTMNGVIGNMFGNITDTQTESDTGNLGASNATLFLSDLPIVPDPTERM